MSPTVRPGRGAFIVDRPARTCGRVVVVLTGAAGATGEKVVVGPETTTELVGEVGDVSTVGAMVVSTGAGSVTGDTPSAAIGVMPAAASSASKPFFNVC